MICTSYGSVYYGLLNLCAAFGAKLSPLGDLRAASAAVLRSGRRGGDFDLRSAFTAELLAFGDHCTAGRADIVGRSRFRFGNDHLCAALGAELASFGNFRTAFGTGKSACLLIVCCFGDRYR